MKDHKTGLPQRLLELFTPREPVGYVEPTHKKAPKLPLTGLGAYLDIFEDPDDPEVPLTNYQPKDPSMFKGPELRIQARITDAETKKER